MAKSLSPEDLLAQHTLEVRVLAEALRQLVHTAVPEATEKAYSGWQGIGYSHPQAGYFCGVFPTADLVKLGFEFGVLLPDPDGLLEGSGSQMRWVFLRPGEDIPETSIKALIQAALDLPSSRQAKLWLIQNKARPVDPGSTHP
jgi:hypothetical protein